jgi:hypothetical protein
MIHHFNKYRTFIFFIILLCTASLSALYLNNVRIFEPLKITIKSDSSQPLKNIELRGMSVLGRGFNLASDTINNFTINNYYLKKICLIIPSSISSDSTLCVKINNHNYFINEYLSEKCPTNTDTVSVALPFQTEKGTWIKVMWLLKSNSIPFIISVLLFFLSLFFIVKKYGKIITEKASIHYCIIFFNALLLILFGLIIYLSMYNYPSPEDYIISLDAKSYGFNLPFSYYLTNDGRYITNLFYYILNPLAFDWVWGYKLIPVFLFMLFWLSAYYLLRNIFTGTDFKKVITITNLLTFIFIALMPSVSYGFYWMASSLSYTFMIIFLNVLIGLTIKYFRVSGNSTIYSIAFAFLIFLLNGLNETSIIITFLWCIAFLYLLIRSRKIHWVHGLILVSFIFSALVVVLSRGNYLRENYAGNPAIVEAGFIKRIILSIKFSSISFFHFSVNKFLSPTYLLLMMVAVPFLYKHYCAHKQIGLAKNPFSPLLIILAAFIIVGLAIPFPYYFSGIGVDSIAERIYNIVFYIETLLILSAGIIVYHRFKTSLPKITFNFSRILVLFFVLLFSFFLGKNTLTDFATDLTNNAFSDFKNEMDRRNNILMTENSFNYYCFNPIENRPLSIYPQDLEDYNQNPKSICNYFGKYDLTLYNTQVKSDSIYLRFFPYRKKQSAARKNKNIKNEFLWKRNGLIKILANTNISIQREGVYYNESDFFTGFCLYKMAEDMYKINNDLIRCPSLGSYSKNFTEGSLDIESYEKQLEQIRNNKTEGDSLLLFINDFISRIPVLTLKTRIQENDQSTTLFVSTYCGAQDSIIPFKMEFIKVGGYYKINQIYLYDYYKTLTDQCQKYLTSDKISLLKVIDLRYTLNPYDSTFVAKSLFINESPDEIKKVKIEMELFANGTPIDMDHVIMEYTYKEPAAYLNEMSSISARKINLSSSKDRSLAEIMTQNKVKCKLVKATIYFTNDTLVSLP